MYPTLKSILSLDGALIEQFILSEAEEDIIKQSVKDKSQLGMAIFYKTYLYLGFPPQRKEDIPEAIIKQISDQMGLNPNFFKDYPWRNSTWMQHLSIIRKYSGFSSFETKHYKLMADLLTINLAINPTKAKISEFIQCNCKDMRIELPSEKKFRRLVNSVHKSFLEKIYESLYSQLNELIYFKMDSSLKTVILEESYDWIKSPAGTLGMDTILEEIRKLQYIRTFKIVKTFIETLDKKLVESLYKRCRTEDASIMLLHPEKIRYALFSILLYVREMEVTDTIIQIFLELTRKIEKSSDKIIQKNLISSVKKVYNKSEILRKLTLAITGNPEGTIKEVILSKVDLETLKSLAEEYQDNSEGNYETHKKNIMKKRYSQHYRRMMKPVLDTIEFKINNPSLKSLLNGLDLVHRYIDTRHKSYPEEEDVPMDLLTGNWKDLAVVVNEKGEKVNKHFYELCVLEKVEKTVKCKELWVEGALKFRDPDKDLPIDWYGKRIEYYNKYKIPLTADAFVSSLQQDMKDGLLSANSYFSKGRDNEVFIYQVGKGERGYFRVPKVPKQAERPIIQEIKEKVIKRWGIIDLIDILLEADRQIDFARFFPTSAQRKILSIQDIRKRLLLILYGLGTNMGLKRIHAASNAGCSYEDLLYFRKRYVNPDSLRKAITALINRILKIRDVNIWGCTTACASDGKQFGSWDQNLIADSNPHYQTPGIMVYWHVDKNSLCIYSQLKNCNSSEVVPMIEGLVRHETDMKIESHYVDSRGQSEIAFAFCRFLIIKLMPRLKRIKYEKLYVPDKEFIEKVPHLKSVIERPIRWDIIYKQYDEMAKHVVAIKEQTGSTESILRRFYSYNSTHPTYKAFIEVGKAEKTIFLCPYLTIEENRTEVHEGLNVAENWNSANTFINHGNKSEFQSNDPLTQEIIVLCLHLLQNAVILTNTIMTDKVINEEGYLSRMTAEDLKALTPLFTANINPFGDFNLNLHKKSFLEKAA